MRRYASVLRVRPESIEKYKEYHAAVWPEVLDALRTAHIQNYSIYLKDDFLLGYFEYSGNSYDQDMAKVAKSPKVQEWWAITEPMQVPIESRASGEWWA